MYLLPASCYAALLSALPQAVFKVVAMRSEAGNTEEKELKWQNLLGATKRLMLSCCVQKVYDRKVCAGINKPSGPIKNYSAFTTAWNHLAPPCSNPLAWADPLEAPWPP